MSMRDYGIDDYGIVLNEDEVISFTRQYLKKNNKERYANLFMDGDEELFDDDVDVFDCQEAVDTCIYYICDFTGEADTLEESGLASYHSAREYSEETVFYIPLLHYPSLFSQAYTSYNDMIQEHKEEYAEYLPADFPWEERFAQIVGTYFG